MGTNVAPVSNPVLQFFNNAGQPNVGGSLLTQVGGVNYPTYQDAAGTTALPNPIPLNSRGEISNTSGVSVPLYLIPSVVYTFTLYDANNNVIWVDDNVVAQGATAVGQMTDELGSDGTPGFKAGTDFTPGTTQSLTLSGFYGTTANLWVAFDAGEQGANTYQLSGHTLTFGSYSGTTFTPGPIPTGTNAVFVKGGTTSTIGTPAAGSVTDATVAADANINATKIRYIPSFSSGQSRTQAAKNADFVSVLDFAGVDPTGATDSTAGIQAALDQGGNIFIPPGTYKLSTLSWSKSNTWLQGSGRSSTIFNFTSSETSGIKSGLQGSSQLFYCRASDIQLIDNAGVGKIVDLTDMQFCQLERCFTYGFGAGGSVGVYMGSSNGTLQCTYNRILDHYNGNTQYGIYMHDGANANIIDGGRMQSGLTGAIGIILAPSAFNLVNGNVLIQVGIEQPGNTLVGIQLNGNTGGTTIISPRLESLLDGIVISSTDVDVALVNPIYSGCTNNLVDASSGKAFLNGNTSFGTGGPIAKVNYDGTTTTTNKAVNCSVTRTGVGAYTISGLPFADTNYFPDISSSAAQCSTIIVSNSSCTVSCAGAAGLPEDAAIYGTFTD